jgi:GNAT superfamily N-acetyltransferase
MRSRARDRPGARRPNRSHQRADLAHEYVGYGQLTWMSRAAGHADHAMLAVRRTWRGRGIAKALKAAQIVWALDNGLSELRTGNDERNASARAVNANFPYTPLPDQVGYRGPLATEP